jgi:hypothetical protein
MKNLFINHIYANAPFFRLCRVSNIICILFPSVLVTIFIAVTKTIKKEERFILVHSFRGVSLSWRERHGEQRCLHHGGQEAEKRGIQ